MRDPPAPPPAPPPSLSTEMIIGRPLADGGAAVLFLNDGNQETTLTCDINCFNGLGFNAVDATQHYDVRDLWQHKVIATVTAAQGFNVSVPPDGASVMVKLLPRKQV